MYEICKAGLLKGISICLHLNVNKPVILPPQTSASVPRLDQDWLRSMTECAPFSRPRLHKDEISHAIDQG